MMKSCSNNEDNIVDLVFALMINDNESEVLIVCLFDICDMSVFSTKLC